MKNICKAIGWLLFNIVIQFMVQFSFSIYAVFTGIKDSEVMSVWIAERLLLTVIISNLLFVVAVILNCKIKKRSRKRKREWKCKKVGGKAYLFPCVIAFAYSMFYFLITYDVTANTLSANHVSARHYDILAIPMLVLALAITASVTEELLCRAIMMNTLKRSFSTGIAMLVSAALFGVMHVMTGDFQEGLGAFFMGILFAVIYEKSNSLYVVIAAHAVANLPDIIFYTSPTIGETLKIFLAGIFLSISAVCLWVWYKRDNNYGGNIMTLFWLGDFGQNKELQD